MVKHLPAPFAVVPGPAWGPAPTDTSKPAKPSKTTDTVQCFPVFPALYTRCDAPLARPAGDMHSQELQNFITKIVVSDISYKRAIVYHKLQGCEPQGGGGRRCWQCLQVDQPQVELQGWSCTAAKHGWVSAQIPGCSQSSLPPIPAKPWMDLSQAKK